MRVSVFFRTFYRAFRGVYHDDLEDNIAFGQYLLARQRELARAQQGVLNGMNGATNSGLAQTVSLSDVGVSAVLAPVHECHQETVFTAQGGRAAHVRQMLFQGGDHCREGLTRNTGQTLEERRLQRNYVRIKHGYRIPDLCKRSIPSPETKLRQHQARGYLVVTTTTISTGAKAMLDGLSLSGEWFTDVWDNSRLTQWLLRPGNDALLRQFFPNSHTSIRAHEGNPQDSIEQVSERYVQATLLNSRTLLIAGIPVPLPRDEVPHIEDTLEAGNSVLVSGDSGTGKSGIAHALCKPRAHPDKPVLLLDARRYANIRDISDLSGRLGLSGSVSSGLRRLGERTGCRLVIDQLDNAANTFAGMALAEMASQCAQMHGVEVVVLSRRRESNETVLLNQLTDQGFVELECGELTESAARSALSQIGISTPSNDLVLMSKNLLNLSLVAQIRKEQTDFDFGLVLDEVALWSGFVAVLLASETHGPAPDFGDQILHEAYRLAREGLQQEDRTCRIASSKTILQRRLESWGIIIQEEGYCYRFKHDNLQDFLYAQNATKRVYMPSDVLAEIAEHRIRNILVWMEKLYKANNSPHRIRFMNEVLNV